MILKEEGEKAEHQNEDEKVLTKRPHSFQMVIPVKK